MSKVRSFTVVECDQRSPEWFAARAGRLTGSAAADVFATLKSGGEPASRRDLRTRLVLERLTGKCQEDDYDNADMRRGRDLEPLARAAYEALTGLTVTQTGFLAHDTLPIGCSLDGHVGDYDGIVEIKAPRSAKHLMYLRAGVLPAEHVYQVMHNLFVTGAAWCDWVSYDPSFPPELQLLVVRSSRDAKEMKAYEMAIRLFLTEVEREQDAIEKMCAASTALARMEARL